MTWDILGIGSSTVDEFLMVDRFPVPDTKQEVLAVDRQGGGLVPTALVAVARLGLRCACADILGDDDLSRWIEADLQREGIDAALIAHHPEARPIHAFVIVDAGTQTRTILYTLAQRQAVMADFPPVDAVRKARVLLIDDVNQANIAGILRAAQTAREAGIPVVADFEHAPHADLLYTVNHLIVSAGYAERATGEPDPARAAHQLWHGGREAVIVTCGAEGSWYLTGNDRVRHQPAFPVAAVDTTGCGDVYHGAYAAGLIWGYSIEQRVQLASACAALKATRVGGRRGIPTRAEVEAFLAGKL